MICKRCNIVLVLLFCCVGIGYPQFNIKFRLINIPAKHKGDSIFIAGNFNNWDPGNNRYAFTIRKDTSINLINLPAGNYLYKITRGNWQNAECTLTGKNIDNRLCILTADTVVGISVAAWQDDFITNLKTSTSSKNVQLLDAAFQIPQLGTTRAIWIYLPPGYLTNTKKRYPVLYMQDGQNIFDEQTAAFGEWGVDECLDSLIIAGMQACIVIGIANGPNRMNEYNPYTFKNYGKGSGNEYADFLVHTLKPYIDKHYRTLSNKENTLIAGSSMGALIAYYTLLKYPEVFGKAGIFSPAFWTAGGIEKQTDSVEKKMNGKLFFYIGKLEGDQYVRDMNRVIQKLGNHSSAMIYAVTDPKGMHNEQAWRKWFPSFYKWIMADGFNHIIDLDK